jgi:hypothetical protein
MIKFVNLNVNVHILASISVLFILPTVHMQYLILTYVKWITVYLKFFVYSRIGHEEKKFNRKFAADFVRCLRKEANTSLS